MAELSLAMIVKNEEKTIGRCLDSVREAVDEIIIADTGSTDATKSVCGKFTDKIFDFEWIDDFAAARNFAFSRATGDYVLWLDADDVILPEDLEKLQGLKTSLKLLRPDLVFCPYAVNDVRFYRERVIRREAGFLWEGFVHECIPARGETIVSDFTVTHKKAEGPYSRRNLDIYQKKIEAGFVLDARHSYYYARELFYHSLYTECAAVIERALSEGGLGIADALGACKLLGDCAARADDYAGATRGYLRAFSFALPSAEIMCALGIAAKNLNALPTAIFWFQSALDAPDYAEQGAFVAPQYSDVFPLLELCCCHYALGDREKAEGYHQRAKNAAPDHPSVIANEIFFNRK